MNNVSAEKLSAFMDGELDEVEAREIELLLEQDPVLKAEFEAIMEADTIAQAAFVDMIEEPVPLSLAKTIQDAPVGSANVPSAPRGVSGWIAATAAALFLAAGVGGGYYAGLRQAPAAPPGWLADIADYHRVYASQVRHLVEVPAAEANHIQTWLTATVGADLRIPNLEADGLTFEGARLLVAAGKPVAQLMYRDADGTVVALCQIATDTPLESFASRTLDGFDMVSWGGDDSNYVIVGPEGFTGLDAIAEAASLQV